MSAEFDDAFVQRFRSRIQDSDTASLVDSAREMRRQAETYRRCAAAAEDALYQRRGAATVLDGEDSVAELSEGQTYEWQGYPLLSELSSRGFAPIDDGLVEVIPSETVYKVNTTKALSFARKRGINISRFYQITPTAPRWSYSDRQKKEETE